MPGNNPCVCHTSETPLAGLPISVHPKRRRMETLPGLVHYLLSPIPFLLKLLGTLLSFFATTKTSTLLFSIASTLFGKNTRGWGTPALAHRSEIFNLRCWSRFRFPTRTVAKALRVFASSGRDSPIRQKKQSPREPLSSPSSPCFARSEEHTSELQSHLNLVCRLLLEKK